MADDVRGLYKSLRDAGYTREELGSEDAFVQSMSNEGERKGIYNGVSKRGAYDLGSYEDYESKYGGGRQKQAEQPQTSAEARTEQAREPAASQSVSPKDDGDNRGYWGKMIDKIVDFGRMDKHNPAITAPSYTVPQLQDDRERKQRQDKYDATPTGVSAEEREQFDKDYGSLYFPTEPVKTDRSEDTLAGTQEYLRQRDTLAARQERLTRQTLKGQQEFRELTQRIREENEESGDPKDAKELQGGDRPVEIERDGRKVWLASNGAVYDNDLDARIATSRYNGAVATLAAQTASTKEQVEDLRERADEFEKKLKERSKELSGGKWSNVGGMRGRSMRTMARELSAEELGMNSDAVNATQRILDRTQKFIDIAEKYRDDEVGLLSALGYGAQDKATDISTWDFGVSDLVAASSAYNILKKTEKGEKLKPEEEALLDAYALQYAAQVEYAQYIGNAYKGAGMAVEFGAFAAQLALNPFSKMGAGAAETFAKWLEKRGLGALNKGVAGHFTRFASKTVGALPSAAGFTALQAPEVAARGLEGVLDIGAQGGEALPDYTETQEGLIGTEGKRTKIKGTIARNGTPMWQAMIGAEEDRIFNNLGMMNVGAASELTGLLWKGVKKPFSYVTPKAVTEYFDKVLADKGAAKAVQLAGAVNPIGRAINFDASMTLASAVNSWIPFGTPTFDTKEKTGVFNPDNMIEGAVGALVFESFGGAVRGATYRGSLRANYDAARQNATKTLWKGKEARLDSFLGEIDSGDAERIARAFKGLCADRDLTAAQKQQAVRVGDWGARVSLTERAYNKLATAENAELTRQMEAMDGSQLAGARLVNPNSTIDSEGNVVYKEKSNAQRPGMNTNETRKAWGVYNILRQNVEGIFGEEGKEVLQRLDKDPIGTLQQLRNGGAVDAGALDVCEEYVNARARLAGIEGAVDAERIDKDTNTLQAVMARAQEDGKLHHAALRNGRKVDVLGETGTSATVIDEDGNKSMVAKSDIASYEGEEEAESILKREFAASKQESDAARESLLNPQLPFDEGDVYSIMLPDGGRGDVTVLGPAIDRESGAEVGGAVRVEMPDGTVRVMDMGYIQQQHDSALEEDWVNEINGNRQRKARQRAADTKPSDNPAQPVAWSEGVEEGGSEETPAEQPAEQPATETQAEAPAVRMVGDSVRLLDGQGNPFEGEIEQETPDGYVVVYKDGARKTKRRHYTKEELAAAEKAATEAEQEAGTEQPAETTAEQPTTEQPATEESSANGGTEQPEEQQQQRQSALSQLPKDEQGNPDFEQAKSPGDVIAAFEELCNGNVAAARNAILQTIEGVNAALKAVQNEEIKPSSNPMENIANQNRHAEAVAEAQRKADFWKSVGDECTRREIAAEQGTGEEATTEQAAVEQQVEQQTQQPAGQTEQTQAGTAETPAGEGGATEAGTATEQPTGEAQGQGATEETAEEAAARKKKEKDAGLIKEHLGEAKTDKQGNPVDEHGKLITEKVNGIDELTDGDFTSAARSVELPKIPENVDKAIGADGKPVIIKKNIFEKNRKEHPDITPQQSREILRKALYSPNLVGQTQPIKRPHYWVAIQTADKNSVVVIEVNRAKDNTEIVGWRFADAKKLEQLKRQTEREGGQFLIQTSEDAAAALSALPSNSSSADKGTTNTGNTQGGGEKNTQVKTVQELKERVNSKASGKKMPESQASKIDLKNFTVKDEPRKALTVVYYKDGYMHATDAHVAIKIRADYPEEYEGKMIDPRTGKEVEGRYVDIDGAIDRTMDGKNITKVRNEDVAAAVETAKELLKGRSKERHPVGQVAVALPGRLVSDGGRSGHAHDHMYVDANYLASVADVMRNSDNFELYTTDICVVYTADGVKGVIMPLTEEGVSDGVVVQDGKVYADRRTLENVDKRIADLHKEHERLAGDRKRANVQKEIDKWEDFRKNARSLDELVEQNTKAAREEAEKSAAKAAEWAEKNTGKTFTDKRNGDTFTIMKVEDGKVEWVAQTTLSNGKSRSIGPVEDAGFVAARVMNGDFGEDARRSLEEHLGGAGENWLDEQSKRKNAAALEESARKRQAAKEKAAATREENKRKALQEKIRKMEEQARKAREAAAEKEAKGEDGGDVPFSVEERKAKKAEREKVERLSVDLEETLTRLNVPRVVCRSAEEMVSAYRELTGREMSLEQARGSNAFVAKVDGEDVVFFNAETLADGRTAEAAAARGREITAHEVLGHYGLPVLMGEEGHKKFCGQVYGSMPEAARERFNAYYFDNNLNRGVHRDILRRLGLDEDTLWEELTAEQKSRVLGELGDRMTRGAADEYIAHLAERVERGEVLPKEEKTLWDSIVDVVRRLLGFDAEDETFGDRDIAKAIMDSKNNLEQRARLEEIGDALEAARESGDKKAERRLTKERDAIEKNMKARRASIDKEMRLRDEREAAKRNHDVFGEARAVAGMEAERRSRRGDVRRGKEETERVLSGVKGQKLAGVRYDAGMDGINAGMDGGMDGDLRNSVGRKRKEVMERRLKKSRPDITEDERRALFDYLDTLDDTKMENAAFDWFVKGTVRLPEDMDKVRQAVEVAGKAKVDPARYGSPMELLEAHADFKVKGKRTNPDDVATLTNRKDYGNGITVYDVADSEESRQNMRGIINTHWGEDCNPWCLLQGDGKGNLTDDSARYWEHYSRYPKRVAFRDGRLLAFFASDWMPTWWDRQDKPHNGLSVERKMDDGSGRTATYTLNDETGEWGNPTDIHKGDRQNGAYEKWHDNGQPSERSHWKDGELDGLYEGWYSNGQPSERHTYKDGKRDGLFEEWYDNGKPSVRSHYNDGELDGLYEGWHENGQLMVRCTYKNGKEDGLRESWYGNGQLRDRSHWKDGERDGLYEEWHGNGQPSERSHWKDGELDGLYEEWHDNGQLRDRSHYKDGELDGLYELWDDNGQLRERCTYKNDRRDGTYESYFNDGRLKALVEYKNGRKDGLCIVRRPWREGVFKDAAEYRNDEKVRDLSADEAERLMAEKQAELREGTGGKVSSEGGNSGDLRFSKDENLQKMSARQLDKDYFAAMERGDEDRMREIIDEAARRKGYDTDNSWRQYQTAPDRGGAESEEGWVEGEDALSSWTLADEVNDNPRRANRIKDSYYSSVDIHGSKWESISAIEDAMSAIRNGEDPMMTIYRAVPKDIKEDKMRVGDWVTMSREYAKNHGQHVLGYNRYRIIEEKVPASQLYWDGNDINEWGFDDGKEYRYKNTKNNRKLNDLVTRDDEGNVIPPSKRFNDRNEDVRFSREDEREFAERGRAIEKAIDVVADDKYEMTKPTDEEKEAVKAVNSAFNDKLATLTEANADRLQFDLGKPSVALLEAGVEDKPMKLYGNKVMKKVRKHGFVPTDLRNLPESMLSPIAIFEGSKPNSFAVLTELHIDNYNVLATLSVGKGGDVDFNIISSTYGKDFGNVVKWINGGKLLKADKEKALSYLHYPAPIAETLSNPRPVSEGKVTTNPETAKENGENSGDLGNSISKNFSDLDDREGVRFSVVDRDEGKSLVGVHNIGEDNLRKALKLGGLANPSVAVIDAEKYEYNGYGDISLITPPELIDSKTGRNAGTWLGDAWTPRFPDIREEGGKRYIEDTNIPASLENISKWMNEQRGQGLPLDDSYNNVSALILPKVNSLGKIRENKGRLLGNYDYSGGKFKWRDDFLSLGEELELGHPEIYDGPGVLEEAFIASKGKNPRSYLEDRFGIKLTKDEAASLKDFIKEVRDERTTFYFETKFNRPVYLNEFAGAVVPEGTGEDIVKALRDAGLRVETYEKGRLEDRKRAVNELATQEDVRFSTREAEEAGERAQQIVDEAEERIEAKRREEQQERADEVARGFGLDGVALPKNAENAEGAAVREAARQGTLRDALGGDWDEFLKKVYQNTDEETLRDINEYARQNGWNFAEATERYLASLSDNGAFEQAVERGVWSNVREAFDDMLRSSGVEEGVSDNDARYALWRNEQNKTEKADGAILARATDVATDRALSNDGDTRFSTDWDEDKNNPDVRYSGGVNEPVEVADILEKKYKGALFQVKEAWQDSMQSLYEFMKACMGKEWKGEAEVADWMNPYTRENRLSSKNEEDRNTFTRKYMCPMYDEVKKLAKDKRGRELLNNYIMSKHGLERNEYMAEREAREAFEEQMRKAKNPTKWDDLTQDQKDAFIGQQRRDYAGLTGLFGLGKDEWRQAEDMARSLVDNYEGSHDTDALWKTINAATEATLKKQLDTGLISLETYDKVRSMYQYYIPLRGFDETTTDDEYAYLNHQRGQFESPLRRAMGRTSVADDPFSGIVQMAQSAILHGNRNQLVKQAFYNFVGEHPSDYVTESPLWLERQPDGTWQARFCDTLSDGDTPEEVSEKLAKFEEDMKRAQEAYPDMYATGEQAYKLPYRMPDKKMISEHQVVVRMGGQDKVLTVNGNPRLAQAINGQTNPDIPTEGWQGALDKTLGNVVRFGAAVHTTWNPDFMVSNYLRDLGYSNVMSWVKENNPSYQRAFVANCARVNPVTVLTFLDQRRRGTLGTSGKLGQYFEEYMSNGGETGYARMAGKDKIRKELAKRMGMTAWDKTKDAYDAIGELAGELGRGIEISPRFATYVTSREAGREIGRAIYDAKEITVNFNKKGAGSTFLGANGQNAWGNTFAFISGVGRDCFMFWNAGVQGTANIWRSSTRNKKSGAKAAAAFGTLALLGYMRGMCAGGDDEKKKKDVAEHGDSYWDLPAYTRHANFCYRGKGGWTTIPLAIELRLPYGIGEIMASYHNGQETETQALYDAADLAGDIITPINLMEGQEPGNYDWVQPIVPSPYRPIYEAGNNRSWTGRDIYSPDMPWNKNEPRYKRAYKNTGKFYIGLSKGLSDLTGGDDIEKGAINIAPEQIQYVLQEYLPFYSTGNQVAGLFRDLAGEKDFSWRDVPIANRIKKDSGEALHQQAVSREYRKAKEGADNIISRFNQYIKDPERYADKIDELMDSQELEDAYMFREYNNAIKEINQEMRGPMVDDEIRKELSKARVLLMRGALGDVSEEEMDEALGEVWDAIGERQRAIGDR